MKMKLDSAYLLHLWIIPFLNSTFVLSADANRGHLTFNIAYPKDSFSVPLPANDMTYQLTFNSAVYGVRITHDSSDQSLPGCCWQVCVQNSNCLDTCREFRTERNITLNGFKLNISSHLKSDSDNVNCRGHVRINVMSYYCNKQTVRRNGKTEQPHEFGEEDERREHLHEFRKDDGRREQLYKHEEENLGREQLYKPEEINGRREHLYKPGEEAYIMCHGSSDGVVCKAVTCQSDGSWIPHSECLDGRCSVDTSTTSEILTSPTGSILPSNPGTFNTTATLSIPGSSSLFSPSPSLFSSSPSLFSSSPSLSSSSSSLLPSSPRLDQTISGSIPLTLSSFFVGSSELSPAVIELSRVTAATMIYATSISSSSLDSSSLKGLSLSSKLLTIRNSSINTESKTTLNVEQTILASTNENQIKTISPTPASFYQSESLSHLTNDSALLYSMNTSDWVSSSHITKVPVLHTDYSMDEVDTKDKPDSKVALGIVIGVFVIIVAVLLAMIFRVVYQSAMESKVEDVPRATLPSENESESHPGVQIDAIELGNPLFININGDFSESTTDDDTSYKSDGSSKSITDRSFLRNQSDTCTTGGRRHSTRQEIGFHNTTFTDDTGCFKVARLSRARALKDNLGVSHNVERDVYAVSYKQRKTSSK
ncbi:serine-rich adhesin for platelets-like isoform X1 [Argopecten irradians]|uniref:serine-rich adhesin for platelets-like isoform X1 n=1 Tax=Argopecten irradians TaxID=31199 RepID=UPI0037207BB2